jgi:hypothetical protein
LPLSVTASCASAGILGQLYAVDRDILRPVLIDQPSALLSKARFRDKESEFHHCSFCWSETRAKCEEFGMMTILGMVAAFCLAFAFAVVALHLTRPAMYRSRRR